MSEAPLSGLILKGTRVEGKLFFKDKMRIDGEFAGEITSENQLIIGKTAQVNADVKVGELIVMGELKGKVSSCDSLQIQEGGRIIGDIRTRKLDIKPGAIFDGKCTMMAEESKDKASGKSQ